MLLAICEMTTCTHNNLHEYPYSAPRPAGCTYVVMGVTGIMYILNLCTLISHSSSFSTVLCAKCRLDHSNEGSN